jgi:hypothetical protein
MMYLKVGLPPMITGYCFPTRTTVNTTRVVTHLIEQVELFEYTNTIPELFLIIRQTSS